MNNKKNTQKNQGTKTTKSRSNDQNLYMSKYPIIVPDRMRVRFVYSDDFDSRLATTGSAFNYFSMRLNAIYDPDPLLATGGIAGFLEWGSLYRRYRVIGCRIHWTLTNLDPNTGGNLFLVPGSAPATPTTRGAMINLSENSWSSQIKSISAKGGIDIASFVYDLDLEKYLGSPVLKNDVTYSGFFGSGASNPSNTIQALFCYYVPSTVTSSVALVSNLKIEYLTEIYDRQTIIS